MSRLHRLVCLVLVCSAPLTASAWPSRLIQALERDARRLLPLSLAGLLAERERQILEATQRFAPELSRLLLADLFAGALRAETLAALAELGAEPIALIRQHRVSDGIVRLGAFMRVPADLSDPVLAAGSRGYPPGVAREYYAFVEANLDKLPVVVDDRRALELRRADLPAYWRELFERSRAHAPVLRTELFRNGRLVHHRDIDYRSPVYGVAQIAYSKAVTAVAATWLALWREARGDLSQMPRAREIRPRGPRRLGTRVPR